MFADSSHNLTGNYLKLLRTSVLKNKCTKFTVINEISDLLNTELKFSIDWGNIELKTVYITNVSIA